MILTLHESGIMNTYKELDPSRECARCGVTISLDDGCEWPARANDTYCWSCQWKIIAFLRQELKEARQRWNQSSDDILNIMRFRS